MSTTLFPKPPHWPEVGFVRLSEIIGAANGPFEAVIPMSATEWRRRVANGRVPAPVRFGRGFVAWDVLVLRHWMALVAAGVEEAAAVAQVEQERAASMPTADVAQAA